MKKETTKLKLILYATGHFIWRWIKNPLIMVGHALNAYRLTKEGGIKKLSDAVFRQYLPKKYLLKTKINLKMPSSSIHGKLKTTIDTEINPAAEENSHHISSKIKILFVRSGALGDVLLTTPIIKKLFKKYDELCSITVATRYPDIFKNNPYIRNVISIHDLRRLEEAYDFILDLDSCYEKNRGLHITHAYDFYTFGADARKDNLQPEIFSTSEDKKIVETFVNNIGPYIVCHNRVDPTQPYRNVPPQKWAELIHDLRAKTGMKIIQIGNKDMDVVVGDAKEGLIDARDQFSLQQAKELIAHATLFLGTDAGPLHIAATTKTPIVSFFSIAHHNLRMPLRDSSHYFKPITPQIDCYGCQSNFSAIDPWYCKRGDYACTSSFDINLALEACLSAIQKTQN
jgi:ADP-heptose:LPS heptosyltransferase